jgi:hypothetical protein
MLLARVEEVLPEGNYPELKVLLARILGEPNNVQNNLRDAASRERRCCGCGLRLLARVEVLSWLCGARLCCSAAQSQDPAGGRAGSGRV